MISIEQRRGRLGRRASLATPAAGVEAVASGLVGVHSSDPATVPLSMRARLESVTIGEVEDALYERPALMRIHGMRRTLFVVGHDLAQVMNSACTQALVARERTRFIKMVEDEGLVDDGARWMTELGAAIERSLSARGEASAVELTEDVPELGKRIAFGAGKKWASTVGVSTRMLFLLATEGRITRTRPVGSWISGQYRWCLTESVLPGGFAALDPAEARERLARHYVAAYGPVTTTDVKWWTGWTLTQTRAALAAVGAVEVAMEAGHDGDRGTAPGWVLPDDIEADPDDAPTGDEPWVALLPALDSTVMGWKERDWYVGSHVAEVFDRNGNAGPTVWADGRIVGGWAQGPTGDVRIRLLDDAGSDVEAMVTAEAERLDKWLGGVRVMPRFPAPLDRALSQ